MRSALSLNRLQRKVLLVVVLIILLPMLVTGVLSAAWIAGRIDDSIERWIREAAQVNQTALADLHKNAQLFADMLEEMTNGKLPSRPNRSPVPRRLEPLARELGINLVQVYGYRGELLYSSRPATLATAWAPGQNTAVVKISEGDQNLLAAITVVRIPRNSEHHYRLVLGTLFDKALLDRLSHRSGLKTRLFYPLGGDYVHAFSEDGRPLQLRLPPEGFDRIKNRQDYYSPNAEDGQYWGLYSPILDSSGRMEAVLFNGQRHTRTAALLSDQGVLTVVIILLGTLLSVGTGLLLSRILVRPVEYLNDAVVKLAAQDFRANIPIHSNDELGELARSFNAMADSLREARDEQRREFQQDKLTALGELSLAMAHEIRNPIGVINTASNLLEKSTDPGKRAELRRVIHEESMRLDHLLKDFQQLARHRKPIFIKLDPAQPLEQALKVMLAGRSDVDVKRRYKHGDSRIRADGELLRQAWVNLVRNALEAMGPGPGTLEVGSDLTPGALVLYLHDSGPGIPLEHVPRLFEPFYSTKEHGSGLGLTIANTLVDANGAQLELVPGDWKGARFAMRFPLASGEKA